MRDLLDRIAGPFWLLLRIGHAGFMLVVGACLLLVGGLFLLRLASAEQESTTFVAPDNRWALTIEEWCLDNPCHVWGKLTVNRGRFSGQELQCAIPGPRGGEPMFPSIRSAEWREDGLVFGWNSEASPQGAQISLREDCYVEAFFHDRPSLVSLRFRENCLPGRCARRVDWIDTKGGKKFLVPCRTTAEGNAPVFTVSGNVEGQVVIDLDTAERSARWRSTLTGQEGVIRYGTDCDPSRQTVETVPP